MSEQQLLPFLPSTPLIQDFRSTSLFKAFVLNALVNTLVVILAVHISVLLTTFVDKDSKKVKATKSNSQTLLTGVATFITVFLVYVVMYVLFGYGGGMLVPGSE